MGGRCALRQAGDGGVELFAKGRGHLGPTAVVACLAARVRLPITRDEVSGRWASLVVRNASRRECYVPIARSLEMLPDVTNEPESYGVLESDTELENKVDRAGSAGQGR